MVVENEISDSVAPHRPWMEGLKPVANPPEIVAVVVGINKYTGKSGYPNLTGAVDDANAFEDFLKRRLVVPAKNIRSLRDEQATRDAIMDAFIFLRDTETAPGQTAQMIFYYAGHGAQDDIPREWKDWITPTGRIEMLCPSDIGAAKLVNRNGKVEEEVVPGIPDRTISALLNQIAQKKGEHITIILDCCSSAGMSRGASDESVLIPRQIFNVPMLNPSIDKDYLSRNKVRKVDVSKEYAWRFRASYVLLAACGREQLAWEDPRTKSGLFTTNLLKLLSGDELDTLTYRSLMDKLMMPKRQTPHCEGKNVNRLLFGNKELSADAAFFLGRRKGNRITIEGGAAQGITAGCQFSVHKTDMKDTAFSPNPSLGCLVATDVTSFSTTLVASSIMPSFRPPIRFYCKLLQPTQQISLYCRDKQWLLQTFPPEICDTISARIVDSPHECDFELVRHVDEHVNEHIIRLDRHNDDSVVSHIGASMRQSIREDDTETLHRVIKAASHYTYHLRRVGHIGKYDIRMEIHELKNTNPGSFEYDLVPVGENLLSQEPATIAVKYERELGMTIINNTDKVFYPYLFYFDPNDFSITDWYSPPLAAGHGRSTASFEINFPTPTPPCPEETTNLSSLDISLIADAMSMRLRIGVDAALPPHSRLSVGYGNSISEPWQFVIPEGQEKDIGFFRLFLSTRPSNFQAIGQMSPFVQTRGQAPPSHEDVDLTDEWIVQTATIIQVP